MKVKICALILIVYSLRFSAAFADGWNIQTTSFRIDDPTSILHVGDFPTLQKVSAFLADAPAYQKIKLVDHWVEMLDTTRQFPLKGYHWDGEGLNLEIASERLQWMIGELIGQSGMRNKQDLKVAVTEWKIQFSAQQKTFSEAEILDLTKRFRGKIELGFVGFQKSEESVKLLDSLFAEWFPYNKPIAELEKILDLALPENKGQVTIRLQSEIGGYEYILTVEKGLIKAVNKIGMD